MTGNVAGAPQAERLREMGMSADSAASKAPQYAHCETALDAAGAGGRRQSYWVPGRVELLGKHTDYAGGRSLLCAIERGFSVRVAAREDARVRVFDVVRNERHEVALARDAAGRPSDWSNYVGTVARRIARDFPDARRGVDIALSSDLPSAAGLSSSTVLVVAVALALLEANGLWGATGGSALFASREELAVYLGAIESGAPYGAFGDDRGVGTLGGSQDHVAVLCCKAGCLSQFAFAPVRREAEFPMSRGYSLAFGVSGVVANKTGAARERYNRLSRAVSRLLGQWNVETHRADATLAAALASAPDGRERMRELAERAAGRAADAAFTARELRDRLAQFLEEAFDLVPAASDALRRGALDELGAIVDRSQHLSEALLGNQVPETVALQRLAREQGAVAASAFGAGFGGSVWALVPTAAADEFVGNWGRLYRTSQPLAARRSNFFVSVPGPHADYW